jgi:hypothetical protein
MVQDAEYFDFVGLGQMEIDDMLLHLDATAPVKEIISWPTSLWVLGDHLQRLVDHGAIRCLLRLSPRAPRIQQDVIHIAESFARKVSRPPTGRHRGLVRRP